MVCFVQTGAIKYIFLLQQGHACIPATTFKLSRIVQFVVVTVVTFLCVVQRLLIGYTLNGDALLHVFSFRYYKII